MTITVELPDDLASHVDAVREALEAFAIEGYRTGALTPRQTREMLGYATRDQLEGFLKRNNVMEGAYDIEDLHRDVETGDKLRAPTLGLSYEASLKLR
jgi:hypothetical protein